MQEDLDDLEYQLGRLRRRWEEAQEHEDFLRRRRKEGEELFEELSHFFWLGRTHIATVVDHLPMLPLMLSSSDAFDTARMRSNSVLEEATQATYKQLVAASWQTDELDMQVHKMWFRINELYDQRRRQQDPMF